MPLGDIGNIHGPLPWIFHRRRMRVWEKGAPSPSINLLLRV